MLCWSLNSDRKTETDNGHGIGLLFRPMLGLLKWKQRAELGSSEEEEIEKNKEAFGHFPLPPSLLSVPPSSDDSDLTV